MLLMNIGWMNHYRGQTASDRIVNGGKYVAENKDGLEVFNFMPIAGKHYGFVEPPRGGTLDLSRLGGSSEVEYVEGVTCIFTATRPKGGRVVIGWYANARVYREIQAVSRGRKGERSFVATCKYSDAVLLAPDLRTMPVPRAREGVWGMGQSNVRYLDEAASASFKKALVALMRDPQASPSSHRGGGGGKQPDPQRRVQIEKAAVSVATDHYRQMGYSVTSVESDNVGWDLEARKDAVCLLIEVKGCGASDARVELTPNEYAQMMRNKAEYRLVIVTKALTSARRADIVSYDIGTDSWRNEAGVQAGIDERIAARIAL